MVEANNLTREKVEERFLKRVAKRVLKGENREWFDVSIAVVALAEIKELNKRYRKKNEPTDELSFKYGNDSGEIVICPEKTEEIGRSLIHGILHLLGYNHEKLKDFKKMKKKEDYYGQ